MTVRLFEFSPAEIEQLAQREHDRYVIEHKGAGWQLGPQDNEKRTNPYLIAWNKLAEEVKEYDRDFIRQLPAVLAKADYEIRRLI